MRIGADFGVSKYRELADEIAKKSVQPFGVVAFSKNNPTPSIFEFATPEGANSQFDGLSQWPGNYVYIYLYRDRTAVDEGYFTATSTNETRFEKRTEVKKERVGTGWILGGIGLGLLGLAAGFRNRE